MAAKNSQRLLLLLGSALAAVVLALPAVAIGDNGNGKGQKQSAASTQSSPSGKGKAKATSATVKGQGDGKITICHSTGSASKPYVEITISVNGLNGHRHHADDIIPAPASGCPSAVVQGSNSSSAAVFQTQDMRHGKITICHSTGSASKPYVEITISVNGLNGHAKHTDDIIPAPTSGCPATLASGSTTEATVKLAKQKVQSQEEVEAKLHGKVTICHATGSASNPYVLITISANGLSGHAKHAGDLIPAPADGCPVNRPTIGGTVTSSNGSAVSLSSPGTVAVGSSTTVTVKTTPGTVVSATGAGVSSSVITPQGGLAKLTITPKSTGVIVVKAAGALPVKKLGAVRGATGASLTG